MQCYTVGLQADDIVIAGSDGLWDNVFPEAATQIAAQLKWRGKQPQDLAEALAVYASQRCWACCCTCTHTVHTPCHDQQQEQLC